MLDENDPIHMKVSVCGLKDTLRPFPESLTYTKNGVSYKNHENDT